MTDIDANVSFRAVNFSKTERRVHSSNTPLDLTKQ